MAGRRWRDNRLEPQRSQNVQSMRPLPSSLTSRNLDERRKARRRMRATETRDFTDGAIAGIAGRATP